MVPKRRYLPSLGSLATFEVAAKHLSFTLAGTELNITQGAISQQIRGLEKALDVTLFIRKHNSLELTPEGEKLLTAVGRGLDDICSGIDQITTPVGAPVITCSGTHAAITCWLKPYVDRFRVDHPEVRFVLLASDEDDTLRNFDEVDISLICGNERCNVGEVLYYLFPETVEPVCSPEYLRQHGPFDTPESLEQAQLLDLHRKHWSSDAIGWQPVSWEDWFRESGVVMPPLSPVLISNHYQLLLEAAVRGEGVMLGWQHLVKFQLESGRLCRLFDKPFHADRGYYLKLNTASLSKPLLQPFIDSVLSDLARPDSDLPSREIAGP